MTREVLQGFFFVALTILFMVAGQVLVKLGMLEVTGKDGVSLQLIGRALANWQVLGGLACAGVASVCWMLALSRLELSLAYPFMGLAIVLVLVVSPVFLREQVSLVRWIGVLVVCLGLWLAARK
ncbi:MAG: SMR family transporter [Armatimonadota bacterium]